MSEPDRAVYADWMRQRGGTLFRRALAKRIEEALECLTRRVLVNPENAREDFRWRMAEVETLKDVEKETQE